MASGYKSNIDAVKKAIKKAEKQTLEEIGEFVVEEAKKNVPVDTGKLRDSITYAVKGGAVNIGIETNKTFSQKDKYYARFQEFGTSKMPAANNDRGYLRIAAEDNINQIIKITKTNMGVVGK